MPDDLADLVRARYPAATDEELARIRGFIDAYCGSELAARLAALEGAAPERPFAFEHDGVLLHGRLDVLHRGGRRAGRRLQDERRSARRAPEEIVEHDYRLQRLVYALACFRAGAEEVEVVYQFLERPDARLTRFTRADVPGARGRALGGDRPDPAPASSARRRASSPAPAVPRSTSSAPARGSRSAG